MVNGHSLSLSYPRIKKVFAPEKTKINESICNMNILCKEYTLTKRKLY